MWYMQNEVVTQYSGPMACPRKFKITEIHRFRVRVKATVALALEGHHFGARFAYDRGQCVGRCFPNNVCTCTEECDQKFAKYGYVVGCNNFYDRYPFPDMQTTYPNGVWYSLPIEGKCDEVTGAHNCTWSAEDAGKITLKELESVSPGMNQCCDGVCTNFWTDTTNYGRAAWRVQAALGVFHRKYPKMPSDPNTQRCDFNRGKWYSMDNWERRNPWSQKKGVGCMKERFDKHVMLPYKS
uniref:Uncharacterized protein n=1 Tax=Zooxanthella nutricula TaxID=1333877 RepID=A0A7S2LJ17_9DINO